jgi:hypothetical protein
MDSLCKLFSNNRILFSGLWIKPGSPILGCNSVSVWAARDMPRSGKQTIQMISGSCSTGRFGNDHKSAKNVSNGPKISTRICDLNRLSDYSTAARCKEESLYFFSFNLLFDEILMITSSWQIKANLKTMKK